MHFVTRGLLIAGLLLGTATASHAAQPARVTHPASAASAFSNVERADYYHHHHHWYHHRAWDRRHHRWHYY